MAKVFVTQIPHKKDASTNALVPSVNMNPAAEYGEIVIMMPPRASFHATSDLVKQLTEHLKDYSIDDGDCLVALGDPTIIAVACAILGKEKGKFTVLKWDRNLGRYFPSRIVV